MTAAIEVLVAFMSASVAAAVLILCCGMLLKPLPCELLASTGLAIVLLVLSPIYKAALIYLVALFLFVQIARWIDEQKALRRRRRPVASE